MTVYLLSLFRDVFLPVGRNFNELRGKNIEGMEVSSHLQTGLCLLHNFSSMETWHCAALSPTRMMETRSFHHPQARGNPKSLRVMSEKGESCAFCVLLLESSLLICLGSGSGLPWIVTCVFLRMELYRAGE